MKYLALSWMALLFFMTANVFAQTPVKDEQHKATFTIILANNQEHSMAGCSATAIAEHVLLTAEHCDVENGLLYLNQTGRPLQNPVEVTEKYYDHMDHMLLVTPGVSFKHVAEYDPDKYKPLLPGEHIYMWGNPGLIKDQYREGYVSGLFRPSMLDRDLDIDAGGPITMFAMPIVGGDSGSAIFSAEDGRLVGVTTYSVLNKFLGTYPLQFTSGEVAQAEGKGTFVYLPDARPKTTVIINLPAPRTNSIDQIVRLLRAICLGMAGFFVWLAVPFCTIWRWMWLKVTKSLKWIKSKVWFRKK